jgi:predicted MPP superfamily phosphohydrolase
MRRHVLGPPVLIDARARLLAAPRAADPAGVIGCALGASRPIPSGAERQPGAAPDAGPAHGVLERVRRARERPRRWFHPARGWVRRLERVAGIELSRRVYPWIPGVQAPYSWQLRRQLTLAEAWIDLARLSRDLDGLRLLLITDLHAGPFVSRQALRESLERLGASAPDVVLLGGDLTTSRIEEFLEHRESFDRLRAPLGVFAVLGNHDHYTGHPARIRELLETAGIRVLHNCSVALRRGGAVLGLAGVDDLLVGEPDLEAALREAPSPVVLLSHNPDLLFDAARQGVDLVLSGHTHGGQVRCPGLPVLVRQSRYRLDEGRYRVGRTELVVSRGLGAVGLPWRVACPPEAVLVCLRAPRG